VWIFFNNNNTLLGTYSSQLGSGSCTLCPVNTYTSEEGSTKCKQCDEATHYAGKELSKN